MILITVMILIIHPKKFDANTSSPFANRIMESAENLLTTCLYLLRIMERQHALTYSIMIGVGVTFNKIKASLTIFENDFLI